MRPGKVTTFIKKSEIRLEDIERFSPKYNKGLSQEQVIIRQRQNLTNKKVNKGVKSVAAILWTNLFSFFNVLLYAIATALIIVKEYGSLFFVGILIFNITIGMIQDFRARKTLQQLQILNAPSVTIIRQGLEMNLRDEDIVLDDVIKVKLGDQIAADGIIIQGTVGVDESLLTGEALTIYKDKGDAVLSGSFVTSGTAYYRADKVGKLAYAQTIQMRARTFQRPTSELLGAINRLFRAIGIFVIAIGVFSIAAAYYQGNTLVNSVKSIAGSLVGMIPSGMYLLTSMTLAVGVIRLGAKKTLVNEMYSIEMLARIDVLCLDKTGTITDGTMNVSEVLNLPGHEDVEVGALVATIINATNDNNPTANTLSEHFKDEKLKQATLAIPFSSSQKYSGAVINNKTYVIGAANALLAHKIDTNVKKLELGFLKRGLRVLLLGVTEEKVEVDVKPTGVVPLALIVIQDTIRKEATETIKWFKENGVQVKIISGDDPISVSEIARQVGVEGAESFIDLSTTALEDVKNVHDYTVFGRVKPNEKEEIIRGLQSSGHTVAMIGDGVNDVLALKVADCSIAMGAGSGAARGVSHLTLLDDNFATLPSIVDEGRRAINNLQKTWSLFLVKTVFAITLSLIYLAASILVTRGSGVRYPFEPKNLYVWELFAIGIASFFLSLQPNKNKVSGTLITNVIKRSLPAGIIIVFAVFFVFILQSFGQMVGSDSVLNITKEIAVTMGVLTMNFLSMVVLYRLSWPFNKYRMRMFVAMSFGAIFFTLFSGLITIPALQFLGINLRSLDWIKVLILIAINFSAATIYVLIDRKLRMKKPKV